MAGDAVSGTNRAVPVSLGENCGRMAIEAKAADAGSVPAQLKTHGRLMGIMAIDAPILDRRMNKRLVELFSLCLVAGQAKLLSGPFHGHGQGRTVGTMARNANTGSHRAMHMGSFAHVVVAVAGGAVGAGRNDFLKIKLPPSLLVTIFAGQDLRFGMNVKTLVASRPFFILPQSLLGQIVDLDHLLQFACGEGQGILSLPQGNQSAEGAAVNRQDILSILDRDSLDGDFFGLTRHSAGQKEILFCHP